MWLFGKGLFWIYYFLNSVPHKLCLVLSELKEFTGNSNTWILLWWVENTVAKGENVGYQDFSPFPQCFQKAFLSKLLKLGIVWLRVILYVCACVLVIPFPKRQILDFLTERVCRQQFQIWWKLQKAIWTDRKHCRKRRNSSLRAIFFFSHSVFKRLVLQTRKKQGLFGRGLKYVLSSPSLCWRISISGKGLLYQCLSITIEFIDSERLPNII